MYEYEDLFTEPSEADRIIGEAQAQLTELLKDALKEHFDKYANAKNNLEEIEVTIRTKQCEIRRLKENIKKLEEQLEKTDKYDMPRKYIDKFVRDITGFYAPGDTVWAIADKYTRNKCPVCNGLKKVTANIAGAETEVCCPKCDGYGYVETLEKTIKEGTISNVHLRLCFEQGRVGVWNNESVFLRGQDSARNVNVNEIFRTKKEAEAAIKSLEGEQ